VSAQDRPAQAAVPFEAAQPAVAGGAQGVPVRTHADPAELGKPQHFAFEAVRATLGASTDVDSCMRLAKRIDALMTQAIEYFRSEGAGIACRAGCCSCCHLRVLVLPHEAIALFRYLGSRMPPEQADLIRRRVLENAAELKQGEGSSRPCAFLLEGRCSAYEVRPAACSGYHSLSAEQCEKAHKHPGGSATGIPISQAMRHVAATLEEGTQQALQAAGLSGARIELHTAVAALIRNPAVLQRWRAGRPLVARG
jgi:Fe-S-cluster containining protein